MKLTRSGDEGNEAESQEVPLQLSGEVKYKLVRAPRAILYMILSPEKGECQLDERVLHCRGGSARRVQLELSRSDSATIIHRQVLSGGGRVMAMVTQSKLSSQQSLFQQTRIHNGDKSDWSRSMILSSCFQRRSFRNSSTWK